MKNSILFATLLVSVISLPALADDLIKEEYVGGTAITIGVADWWRGAKEGDESIAMMDRLHGLGDPEFKKTAEEIDQIGYKLLSKEELDQLTKAKKLMAENDAVRKQFIQPPHTWAEYTAARDQVGKIETKRILLSAENKEVQGLLSRLNYLSGTKGYTPENMIEMFKKYGLTYNHAMIADHPQYAVRSARGARAIGRGLGLIVVGGAMVAHGVTKDENISEPVKAPEPIPAEPEVQTGPTTVSSELQ